MRNIHFILLGLLLCGFGVFIGSHLSFFAEGFSVNYFEKVVSYLQGLKPDQVVTWVFSLLGIVAGLFIIDVAFTTWITIQQRSIDKRDEEAYELHLQIAEFMKTKEDKK